MEVNAEELFCGGKYGQWLISMWAAAVISQGAWAAVAVQLEYSLRERRRGDDDERRVEERRGDERRIEVGGGG